MLLATGVAAYFDESYWLLVPVGLIFFIYTMQQPLHLFYILLATIPWSIEYNITPALGTDLPDEPLMLLLSFISISYIIFKRKELSLRKIHPLVWLVIFHFIWLCVTVIFSSHLLFSIKFALAKGWYLFAFVAAPLFFVKDAKELKTAAIILVVCMVSFAMLALYKHAPYNWSFEKINTALEPVYRNHVNYSALLVFMVPIQLAIIRLVHSRQAKNILIFILLISLVALYFSYARGAWLSLITGYGGYWLLKKRMLFFGFVLGMFLTIAAVFYLKHEDRYVAYSHDYKTTVFHTNFKEHLVATYKMKDVSTAERYYRWIAGVRMIKDGWQTGFGPNTFYYHYKSYTVPAYKTWVSVNKEKSTVHNYFLFLLIEQGILGFLLFVFTLGAMFWYLQRIYARTSKRFWKIFVATMASILVMICTINFLSDLIESDKVGSIFYIILAFTIIADRKTKQESDLAADIQGIS